MIATHRGRVPANSPVYFVAPAAAARANERKRAVRFSVWCATTDWWAESRASSSIGVSTLIRWLSITCTGPTAKNAAAQRAVRVPIRRRQTAYTAATIRTARATVMNLPIIATQARSV